VTDLWKAQRIPMPIRLGEVTLLQAHLNLLVMDRHFSECCDQREAWKKPSVDLPRGIKGYLIRSSPVEEKLARIRFIEGAIRYVPSQYKRFYVDLKLGTEEYLKQFSGKSRSTLKRKIKRFSKFSGGEINWKIYRTPEELETFYNLARKVSQKTFQERLLNAGLPVTDDFRNEMVERALRGEASGYLLFHENRPISYLYTPMKKGIVRYQYLGFDPEFSWWSPGVILQWLVLERLFENQEATLFDFLEGETALKSFFATGSRQCADIFYLKPAPSCVALLLFQTFFNGLSVGVGAILDRIGLKARLRKLIRAKWLLS